MVNLDKRTARLSLISDPQDIEFLFKLLVEFEYARGESCLHLNTAELRFSYFCQAVDEAMRMDLDNTSTASPVNTNAAWIATLHAFIANYVRDTDVTDQTIYLQNKKKPLDMTVRAVMERIKLIGHYMEWFPGAPGEFPFDNEE